MNDHRAPATPAPGQEEPRRGMNLDAGAALLRERGITAPVPFIAGDFDAPLAEDFLLQPLPGPA